MDRSCFSCGVTQEPLVEHELETFPRRDVDLCEDCARTFRDAGLLAPPHSLTAASSIAPPNPA